MWRKPKADRASAERAGHEPPVTAAEAPDRNPVPEPEVPGPGRHLAAAALGALSRLLVGTRDFAGRVYRKAGQDDIFFLAGGIAFNIIVGAVPFLLLLISIFGFVLRAQVADPQQAAIDYVFAILPPSPSLERWVREQIGLLLEDLPGFGLLGLALLVWISTRLIGSLRSALRDVFDIQEDRGIVQGKIFDSKMVVVAGTLFIANTLITVLLEAVQTYGIELLGLREGGTVKTMQFIVAQLLAYAFIFLMFLLIYRFLPARRIPWRIAFVSAVFTAVVFELLKSAFTWYVAYIANYRTTYGYFTSLVVLMFWIYYSAVVFVLGGEVGQIYGSNRIRQRQRELLD
jgi:membrane protein